MSAANNSLEQNIAVGVAAQEIVQDSASVGTALKTISMRIRAMDEETESYDATLESIKGNVNELTGVSVMSDSNNYKSTYDVLKDIANVWDTLTDKQRAGTLEELFGKRQANIGSAIIKNFSQAEAAMDKMANSAGSADAEFEKAQQGISFKLNALKETGVGIFQNILDSDAIKTGVDLLTNLLGVIQDLTSALGGLGTIGAIGGGILGAKGLGWANV